MIRVDITLCGKQHSLEWIMERKYEKGDFCQVPCMQDKGYQYISLIVDYCL